MHINLLYSLYVIIISSYAHSFIYRFFIRINMCVCGVCVCVLKLQKNLESIVNLSSLQ